MNESLGQRIAVACLAVAITVMLLLGLWAFIGLAAGLQGAETTNALVPTIGAILLAAVSIIVMLWLIRMVRSSRGESPESGDDADDGEPG